MKISILNPNMARLRLQDKEIEGANTSYNKRIVWACINRCLRVEGWVATINLRVQCLPSCCCYRRIIFVSMNVSNFKATLLRLELKEDPPESDLVFKLFWSDGRKESNGSTSLGIIKVNFCNFKRDKMS